jgi:hypothetical protein
MAETYRGGRGKQSIQSTINKLRKDADNYNRTYRNLYYLFMQGEESFKSYEDYYWMQQEMAGVKQIITAIRKRINIYNEILKSEQQEAKQCN